MLLATFFGGTDFPVFGKLGGTKNPLGRLLDGARGRSPLAVYFGERTCEFHSKEFQRLAGRGLRNKN
jgi:hypothetical protein